MLYGAIIEGVATLLCRLTSKYLGDLEPKYASAIDSFIATSLVVAAFDYSGGYYNPVLGKHFKHLDNIVFFTNCPSSLSLATGLKIGCKGHSHLEHFLVYWVGASLGALASMYIYPLLKKSLGVKEKSA